MNIQIIGTRKCKETQKATRFFKERGVNFHHMDLNQRPLSPGELDNILHKVDAESLLDSNSPSYKKRGMSYMSFDIREELLEDPGLIRTPVVRNGREVTVGYDPDTWDRWLKG